MKPQETEEKDFRKRRAPASVCSVLAGEAETVTQEDENPASVGSPQQSLRPDLRTGSLHVQCSQETQERESEKRDSGGRQTRKGNITEVVAAVGN